MWRWYHSQLMLVYFGWTVVLHWHPWPISVNSNWFRKCPIPRAQQPRIYNSYIPSSIHALFLPAIWGLGGLLLSLNPLPFHWLKKWRLCPCRRAMLSWFTRRRRAGEVPPWLGVWGQFSTNRLSKWVERMGTYSHPTIRLATDRECWCSWT